MARGARRGSQGADNRPKTRINHLILPRICPGPAKGKANPVGSGPAGLRSGSGGSGRAGGSGGGRDKFIGFGDLHGPKPYKFIGFGDLHGPKPYKFIGFGDLQGDKWERGELREPKLS